MDGASGIKKEANAEVLKTCILSISQQGPPELVAKKTKKNVVSNWNCYKLLQNVPLGWLGLISSQNVAAKVLWPTVVCLPADVGAQREPTGQSSPWKPMSTHPMGDVAVTPPIFLCSHWESSRELSGGMLAFQFAWSWIFMKGRWNPRSSPLLVHSSFRTEKKK